jgi:spermidine synthase
LASEIVKPILWLCFFASGAAALALEVLWMRSAGLVVGATAGTTAAVLASYFGGLGLGGLLARERPPRPVRRYGFLELVAAAGALWSWLVFSASSSVPVLRLLESMGLAGKIGLVALAILPATVALGATLPTLGAALASPSTVGWHGGSLYALNTLGGIVGIGAMGFGLPLWIGVRASYLVTAATSALAGALALWVGDTGITAHAPAEHPASPPARLRIAAAGGGFLAITLEVLWIKLFAQVLHNSVYSFAAVSLVFLLAIAIGAAAAATALRRASAERIAAASLLAAAVS